MPPHPRWCWLRITPQPNPACFCFCLAGSIGRTIRLRQFIDKRFINPRIPGADLRKADIRAVDRYACQHTAVIVPPMRRQVYPPSIHQSREMPAGLGRITLPGLASPPFLRRIDTHDAHRVLFKIVVPDHYCVAIGHINDLPTHLLRKRSRNHHGDRAQQCNRYRNQYASRACATHAQTFT